MRISEEAAEEVANFGAAGLMLGHTGFVYEGAPLLPMIDVALLLEDSDRGEDGVVGQRFAFGHGCYQVTDGGFAAEPQDLHEPELGFGERDGLLWRHQRPFGFAFRLTSADSVDDQLKD